MIAGCGKAPAEDEQREHDKACWEVAKAMTGALPVVAHAHSACMPGAVSETVADMRALYRMSFCESDAQYHAFLKELIGRAGALYDAARAEVERTGDDPHAGSTLH